MAPSNLSEAEQLLQLRQDVMNHAKSLSEIVTDQARLREDQRRLAETISSVDKLLAVRAERDKHVDDRFDRIEESIRAIHRLGMWVLGAFGAAFIALVVNFTFSGGFIVS